LKLLAVIVNYRTADLTLRAAEGLLRELAALPQARLAIVDNDSGDDSLVRLRAALAEPIAAGRVEVIASPRNGGFAWGVNQAVRPALASADPPEFVYLLNSDAHPAPGAVLALLRFLEERPEIGIAGSYIHGPDGETHHTAFRFPSVPSQFEQTIGIGFVTKLLDRWVVSKPVPSEASRVDWLAGASMLIRREVFDAIGLLDESYFMYFEETDFCLNAARAGWPTWYYPESRVEHVGAASSGWKDFSQPRPSYWFEGRRTFFRKNHGRLGLWAANLAWIVGYALGETRRVLQRRPRRQPPRMFRDFLRHNLKLGGDAWKYGILVLAALVPIELASAVAGRVLAARGLFYVTPDLDDFDEYLALRDPLLGWPRPSAFGQQEYDATGARVSPRFPDPASAPSCVTTFGDSFTWGDEVGPEHAYPNVLSDLLGCRVANYGVPGFGTDQAYLRFRDRVRDAAPVAVLGHWSEDVIRNVNRYRGFLAGNALGFKPRFLVGADGELELLPMPDLDAEQVANLADRPELLPHEFFFPGGPSGVVRLDFPYTLAIARLFGHYRMRAWMEGEPSYAQFYAPEHASGALDVTVAVLRAFVRDARARGQEPVVVLIPDEKDLQFARAGRALPYAPLGDALRAAGIEHPDVAGAMLRKLDGRDPCDLFTNCGRGHFNPDGYAELARVVEAWIREHDLLRAR